VGIRRKAREIAMQTLYALEFADQELAAHLENPQMIIDKLNEIAQDSTIDKESKIYEFSLFLVKNICENIKEIDQKIDQHSTNWPLQRLATLDRTILRLAIFELNYTETASAIIINEAIEIAKRFSSESSGKFINGVLNSVAENKNES